MPASENTATGTSGQRHPGRGRRSRSGAAPHGPPDAGVLAREAVISFLQDASKATAERGAGQAGAAAPQPTAAPGDAETAVATAQLEAMLGDAVSVAGEPEARRLASIGASALDRIEAAAAKVEADIAVAHQAYEQLQAGAGAAAEAAVNAAESAMASAGTAVEAERQVRISLRQVRQNVVITAVLCIVVIIILVVATSALH